MVVFLFKTFRTRAKQPERTDTSNVGIFRPPADFHDVRQEYMVTLGLNTSVPRPIKAANYKAFYNSKHP